MCPMLSSIDPDNNTAPENMEITPSIYASLPPMMKEGIQTDYTATTKVWYEDTASKTDWDASEIEMKARPMTGVSVSDPTVRDLDDTGNWEKGAFYYEGELVNSMSAMYECSGTVDGCSTERPKAGGANWRTPVKQDGEDNFVFEPPASMKLTAQKWKRGAKTGDTAYELGMVALGKDGKLYTCDPFIVNPSQTVEFKPVLITEEELKDDGTVDPKASFSYEVETIKGCTKYGPGSKKGKKFWLMNNDTSLADMIPPEVKFAAPWNADNFYPTNAVSVGTDNVIYYCGEMSFCDVDPATRVGKLGWETSDFKTTDIKNLCYVDATGRKEEDPNSGFLKTDCTPGDYDATKATANYHSYWIEMKGVNKATGCGGASSTVGAVCADDPSDARGAIDNMLSANSGAIKGTNGMPAKRGDKIVMTNLPDTDGVRTNQALHRRKRLGRRQRRLHGRPSHRRSNDQENADREEHSR